MIPPTISVAGSMPASRWTVRLTGGSTRLAEAGGAFDRFVATYLVDLPPERAHDVPGRRTACSEGGGRPCVAGMTEGGHRVGASVEEH